MSEESKQNTTRRTEKFYDVRLRMAVYIPRKNIEKGTFTDHHGHTRYSLVGQTIDGRKLTKFVDKSYWDAI